MPIYFIIVQVVPLCMIIGTTVPTLKYLVDASKSARRVKGSIPWQGAMTVTLTAVVFCISNLPMFIYFIGASIMEKSPESLFHSHYPKVGTFLQRINIMANFFIYTLTIKSFRRFISSQIQSVVPTSLLDSKDRSRTTRG